VEYAAGRDDLAAAIAPFEVAEAAAAARAERALGLVVEGSCEVPLGAHARVEGGTIALDAFLGLPDGTRLARACGRGSVDAAEALGREVADRLLASGGREILAQLKAATGGAHTR
jgi:hydroxymethylbilane synthase